MNARKSKGLRAMVRELYPELPWARWGKRVWNTEEVYTFGEPLKHERVELHPECQRFYYKAMKRMLRSSDGQPS